jgi:hypothetical protein
VLVGVGVELYGGDSNVGNGVLVWVGVTVFEGVYDGVFVTVDVLVGV